MTLDTLVGESAIGGPVPPVEVSGLQYDSRKLRPGEVFFAFPGAVVDGHEFIPAALDAGAAAVVSERERPAGFERVWVRVAHGRRALARAALEFYGRPDRRLTLIGVTGTNGKTTTVHLIDSILRQAGLTTARLGTVEHRVGQRRIEAINTTPESLDVVCLLAELEREQGTHATLEASSHALELRRIDGMRFHTAVFTNLSKEHLDFHPTMEAYARAKRRLFEGAGGPPPSFGVINRDDPVGKEFLRLGGFTPLSYGTEKGAEIRAENVDSRADGLAFEARTPKGSVAVASRLRGDFNVANILAAIGAGLATDIDLETIAAGVAACRGVPGRFETVELGQPFLVVVDFAHTPDALKNLIESARRLLSRSKSRSRSTGRILTVFGCGGDRDRRKRPEMGEIAARLSDRVILTSDNPRTEDPLNIINDVLVGLRRVDAVHELEPDRAAAIGKALETARAGDIVLIAGKGHETYQIIGREKTEFDDRETARRVLRQLGYDHNGRESGGDDGGGLPC